MASHQYEVALFGEFFSKDLKPILNRITLHCESSEPMHSREVVFEPLDAQLQRDQGQEPTLLRVRKELIVGGQKVESPWYVSTPL
jgi:mediator of RNA polymerase II transcription subunit 18